MFLARMMSGEESAIDVSPCYPYFTSEEDKQTASVSRLKRHAAIHKACYARDPNYLQLPPVERLAMHAEEAAKVDKQLANGL